MPEQPQLPDLARWLNELERRVGIMERASTLRNASMTDGTLTFNDTDGTKRVQLGLLDDGTYGLGVIDSSGNFVSIQNYIFGLEFDQVITTESTSSTSPVDLATVGPEVTVNVGPSGEVIVSAGAYIGLPGGASTGAVYLFIDGGLVLGGSIIGLSNSNAAGIAVSVSNSRKITTLDEGPHTFTLKYANISGVSTNFSARTLLVQPV